MIIKVKFNNNTLKSNYLINVSLLILFALIFNLVVSSQVIKYINKSTFNWVNSEWKFNGINEFEYDKNGNVINENLSDANLNKLLKWTYKYNELNSETEVISMYWSNNIWMNSTRRKHEYDTYGNLKQIADEKWDSIAKNWLDDGAENYYNAYDSQNRIIEMIQANSILGNVNKEKYIYSNDTIVKRYIYSWNRIENKWTFLHYSHINWLNWSGHAYNSIQLADTTFNQPKANLGDSSFYPESLTTYVNDSLKKLYIYTLQYNRDLLGFSNEEKDTVKRDELGNDTATYTYKWEDNKWRQRENNFKNNYQYNNDGTIQTEIIQQSSPLFPKFINHIKYVYGNYINVGFSVPTIKDNDIIFYPNPTKNNIIYIKSNNSQFCYTFYNDLGMEISPDNFNLYYTNTNECVIDFKTLNGIIYLGYLLNGQQKIKKIMLYN